MKKFFRNLRDNGLRVTLAKIVYRFTGKRYITHPSRLINNQTMRNFDFETLLKNQANFIKNCEAFAVRNAPSGEYSKKYLVFLQAGAGLVNPERFKNSADTTWDLIINHYDHTQTDNLSGIGVSQLIYQAPVGATKFLGFYGLAKRFPEIIKKYDYVCFLDDDVEVGVRELNHLFSRGEALRLDLFQLSLTEDSAAEWPALKIDKTAANSPDFSYFTTVEVMAPVISKRLLQSALPFFKHSISTWGIDFALGELCSSQFRTHPAVIHSASMRHAKKSDQAGGAFYQMLKKNNLIPLEELKALILLAQVRFSEIQKIPFPAVKVDHNINFFEVRK